jgi:hypothetical protein
MTWFKVDDGLHSNRKRVRAGHEAMGLWVIAGSWAADELTDGWVPDDVIEYLVPVVGHDLAKRLERAGLWNRKSRDGEEGWQFRHWDEYQPSKVKVLHERAAAAERQARARDRARAVREAGEASRVTHAVSHKRTSDDCGSDWSVMPSAHMPGADPLDSPEAPTSNGPPKNPDTRGQSRQRHGVTHADVTGVVTGPPTRPDPTRPSSSYGTTKVPPSADALFDPSTGKQPKPITSQAIIAAYVDGSTKANLDKPSSKLCGRIGRDAKRLIEEGKDPAKLVAAAAEMGGNGFDDLDMAYRRLDAQRNGRRGGNGRPAHAPLPTAEELAEGWRINAPRP